MNNTSTAHLAYHPSKTMQDRKMKRSEFMKLLLEQHAPMPLYNPFENVAFGNVRNEQHHFDYNFEWEEPDLKKYKIQTPNPLILSQVK